MHILFRTFVDAFLVQDADHLRSFSDQNNLLQPFPITGSSFVDSLVAFIIMMASERE
jgi:hypothetical protein